MRGITQAIVAVLLVVGAVSVAGVGLATDHDGGKIAQSEVDDVALNHDAAQERPDGGSREQSDEDAARADNNEADRSDEDDAADDGNDTRLSMMGGEVYSWGHSHVENGDGDSSQPDEDDRERSEQTSDGDDIQQRTSTVVTVVNSSLDGREGSMEVMEFHHQVVLVDGIEDGESNTETDEVSQKRAEAGAGDGVDGEATTVESRMKMFIKIDGMPVAGPDGSGDGNVTERATACCMKAFIKIEEMPNASAIIDTGTKVEYVQHTLEVSSVSGNGDDIILGDYLLPSIVGGDDDVSQRASTVVTVVSSPTGGREGSMDVMEFHHEIVRVDGQEGQQSTESSLSQNRAEVGSGHNAHRSPSEVDGADDGSDARSMTGNGTDTAVGWRHHYDYYWYSNPNDTGPEVEYFRYTLDVNRGPGLADDDLPCWFPPLGPGPYNPQPEEPCPSIDTAASSDISVNTGAQSDADSDTDGLGDGIELAIHNESIIEATIGGGGGNFEPPTRAQSGGDLNGDNVTDIVIVYSLFQRTDGNKGENPLYEAGGASSENPLAKSTTPGATDDTGTDVEYLRYVVLVSDTSGGSDHVNAKSMTYNISASDHNSYRPPGEGPAPKIGGSADGDSTDDEKPAVAIIHTWEVASADSTGDLPCWVGTGPTVPTEPCPPIGTVESSDVSVDSGAQSGADADGETIELAAHNESNSGTQIIGITI